MGSNPAGPRLTVAALAERRSFRRSETAATKIMLSAGIVGLPNVGKSTLFNAVTRTHKAPAENYPFCTIDPNVGIVIVPDPRLQKIAEISRSKKITPTAIEFAKDCRDFALEENHADSDRVCGHRRLGERRERG